MEIIYGALIAYFILYIVFSCIYVKVMLGSKSVENRLNMPLSELHKEACRLCDIKRIVATKRK